MGNKSKAAGILSIISGAFGILWLGWAFLAVYMFSNMSQWGYMPYSSSPPQSLLVLITVLYTSIGMFFTLVGILGIVGGVSALRKRRWAIALAGAIAGTITFFPCGIPAVILISMAKEEEFSEPTPPAPAGSL